MSASAFFPAPAAHVHWIIGVQSPRSLSMTSRRSSDNWLWVAAALSLGISLTRFGPLVLYPFKLFTTWVHECGHAVMTVVVGGRVNSIVIEFNTTGITRSLIPEGRIAQGLVASAGYLGASIVGCVLMTAARGKKRAHAILLGIGACMLATLAIWIRNPFGIAVVLIWSIALIALSRHASGPVSSFVLSLLAVQVALDTNDETFGCSFWCTSGIRTPTQWPDCLSCQRGSGRLCGCS